MKSFNLTGKMWWPHFKRSGYIKIAIKTLTVFAKEFY